MTTVSPARMQGPKGISSAEIHGHTYEVPKDGIIKVAVQDHVDTLRRHGFTDYVDDRDLDTEIEGMDREELTTFVEERGGDVPAKIKMKDLRALAKQTANQG